MAAVVDGEGQIFTRGGPDVPDNRGRTMVEKHVEKLQQEKEAKAMEKIQALVPGLDSAVLSLALGENGWDVDRAVVMLRRFQVAKGHELRALEKERKKHEVERERERRHREQGDSSDSGSSDSDSRGSSSSESESEDERRRRKDKKRRRSRSRSRSRGGKKERSSKRKKGWESSKKKEKKKRQEHKEKKAKPAKGVGSAAVRQEEYGKYGIIRETDMYAKRPEFQLWAAEVKKVDLELMPKFEEKELFKDFMEDYNTASLPHSKYYDLEVYERRRAIKAAKKGLPPGAVEATAFDDEEQLKRERAAKRARDAQERMQEAYRELVETDKAEDMRAQELLRLKMGLAYRTGDVVQARRIAEKLKPDDVREYEAARNAR